MTHFINKLLQQANLPLTSRQFWRYTIIFWVTLAVVSYIQNTLVWLISSNTGNVCFGVVAMVYHVSNVAWLHARHSVKVIDLVTALSDMLRGVMTRQNDNFLSLRDELKLTDLTICRLQYSTMVPANVARQQKAPVKA